MWAAAAASVQQLSWAAQVRVDARASIKYCNINGAGLLIWSMSKYVAVNLAYQTFHQEATMQE